MGSKPCEYNIPLGKTEIMPYKAKRPCKVPLCPNYAEEGSRYCKEHARMVSPRYDPRPNASQRGYDWRWQRLRKLYLKHNPLCERCKRMGSVTSADTVHHKKQIKEYPELRLEWDNLESLCRDCHEVVEGRKKEKKETKKKD